MPKIRKKRMSFVIDMTPLVDITFLLLTFLMFTAKFKSEAESQQQFTIVRPKATADSSKLPEKDLAMISIAVDDKNPTDTSYFYGLSNTQDQKQVWSLVKDLPPSMMDKMELKVDTTILSQLIRATLTVRNSTRFAIDADKGIRFKYISTAMNILRKNRATVFNFVTDKRKK